MTSCWNCLPLKWFISQALLTFFLLFEKLKVVLVITFFGLINSIIYLVLALQKGFYGEILTTLYFTIMQPIGLLVWIYQAQFKKEKQEFVARKLDSKGMD